MNPMKQKKVCERVGGGAPLFKKGELRQSFNLGPQTYDSLLYLWTFMMCGFSVLCSHKRVHLSGSSDKSVHIFHPAPKDLWKEAMKKEAMRTNNSASMEESYSPALREALLDDMPPTLGSPYENTSL